MNDNHIKEEDTIDLLELFYVLLRKWWLILLVGILGAAIAFSYTYFLVEPLYESKSMLYILNKTTSVTSMADLQIGTELTADFEVIALSNPVLDRAAEQIKKKEGKAFTRNQIKGMLTVANEADTRILTISAISANPEDACMVANAVAEQTATRMAEIMKSDAPTTVQSAEIAKTPISPNKMKNTIMGFLAGAVLLCAVLVIQYLVNDNIRTEEDVEKYLGVSTILVLPNLKGKTHKSEELKQLNHNK